MAPFRARFECGLVSGHAKTLPVTFERLPLVAADFCAEDLRANIRDSQRNGQKFRDFTHRAMAAGVQGYYAFLRGRRVTYLGRQGDQHTEWFPGAGPTGTQWRARRSPMGLCFRQDWCGRKWPNPSGARSDRGEAERTKQPERLPSISRGLRSPQRDDTPGEPPEAVASRCDAIDATSVWMAMAPFQGAPTVSASHRDTVLETVLH